MKKVIFNFLSKYAVAFIAVTLFLIPLLFWGQLYHVGGDDTRLYYVMPKPFFEHYSSSIITQNRLGTYGVYASPAFLTPFYIFIWIISLIPWHNVQFAMYGVNLAAGFVFFYLLMGKLKADASGFGWVFKIAAALSYVLSNFVITTLYTHELMSIFAVSVCPLLLYLFIISVREERYILPVLCALIYSAVSATLITLPWYGAFFFSVLPLLFLEFKRKPLVFIKITSIFLCSFLVLNTHWIIHLIASQLITEAGSSAALSFDSLKAASRANANYIAAISHLNPILAQFFQQERTGWGMNIVFNPLNSLYLWPVLLGGILFARLKRNNRRTIYLLSIFSFLFTVILFTPNIDVWSLKLFLLLNSYVPLFAMFKTSYDKFALPLAFQYAFLLSWSLWIIGNLHKKLAVFFACAIIVLTVYSGFNFLFPQHRSEQFSTKISGTLNQDFNDMVRYLKNMDTGAHFVWLPLTFPSYIYIEDGKLPNHFYSGPSIITPLTNKIDYTGELSFDIPSRPGIAQTIIKNIKERNYEAVGKIFQELGIRYIIVNKQRLPASSANYALWLWGSNKLDTLQDDEFINHMTGNVIASFGDRYELYEINPAYITDVLYLTASLSEVQLNDNFSYVKNNEGEYTVTINNADKVQYMVLLEPYYRTWRIYLEDKQGKYTIPYMTGMNTRVYDYANAWKIDTAQMRNIRGYEGGDQPIKLKIIFEPKRLQNIGNFISITGYIISIALVLYAGYVQKKGKSVN
ncbi:MAG: hypothetical protein ACOY3M_04935 [Patescibacteria group bacterium]